MQKLTYSVLLYFFLIEKSFAYLGPGLGAGIVAGTLGIILAIFACLFGILWFPIKRFLKRRKSKKLQQENSYNQKED